MTRRLTSHENCASLANFFRGHLIEFPASAPQDLYKLAHQSWIGCQGTTDVEAVTADIRQEATITLRETDFEEELWPESGLVRCHFGLGSRDPGRARRLASRVVELRRQRLLGRRLAMAEFADVLSGLAKHENSGLPGPMRAPFLTLAGRMEKQGFPPVSHSARYRLAYNPHYRVALART